MAAFPDAAVGLLLENLKEFLLNNADLIAGAEETVKTLCEELEVLKGFVKNCTEEYSNNDFLNKLAKNVRKLVHRAEDAIEDYIVTASMRKSRGAVTGAFHVIDHAVELRNIGRELEAIKQEVQQLYNIRVEHGFKAMQLDNASGHERRVKKPPVDDDMVGFKDAMEDVRKLLHEGPDDLQTVSIVGMLGLGKTTLARKVFKHPTVEYQFFIRAFVEVSAEYKTKDVFLKILRACGIVKEEMNRMSEDEVAQEIRNHLQNRSYLIVLDDVWTKTAWEDLKRCFPMNQKHSRVLITTRHENVAKYAAQGVEPYKLRFLTNGESRFLTNGDGESRFLTYGESRELLRKRVFGKKDEIKSDLREHETRILDRCDGLPLAIVVVAGILTNHGNEAYWWKKVAENVKTFNLAETEQANYVIKLSFNNLPYRLKPCFLYLGVFREDFEIPSKTVVQLWVSEGFVPPANGDGSSEDIAEDYLEELVDRSLVMVDKRRSNGRIKTIRIHGTLREFCKVQAIEEEIFREIKMPEQGGIMSSDNDRRICINSNVLEYIKSKPSGKYVRSFLSFAKEDFILPIEHISHIPEAFKLVRVLDIRSIKLTRFPPELYWSFLLKYIAMYCDLKIIPQKVSNLRYLQTLIVKTTHHSLQIKADIWKMTQLRHLETNASTSLLKTTEAPSVNANLQTLSAISPESCRSEVLDRAPQLKKLGICGTLASVLEATGQDSLFDTLSRLEFLENLKLLNDNTTVRLQYLPSENCFPTKLTKLTLRNTMLDWRCMSTLGKLKKLEVLKLKENSFLGPYWDTESDGFCALQVLHIGSTDLITWKASASHFPNLKQLYLKNCTKLEAIPSDLANISTLKLIDIYWCNGELAKSARKLQLAKLQMQAQDKDDKSTTLKLSVYPPDQ